jgi:hypothetical protein
MSGTVTVFGNRHRHKQFFKFANLDFSKQHRASSTTTTTTTATTVTTVTTISNTDGDGDNGDGDNGEGDIGDGERQQNSGGWRRTPFSARSCAGKSTRYETAHGTSNNADGSPASLRPTGPRGSQRPT